MTEQPGPRVPEPTRKIGDYEVHPFRLYVPEKTDEEYAEYLAYIRENGSHHLITLDVEGRILDGRATLKACLELGIRPNFHPKPVATNLASFVCGTMAGKKYSIAQQAFTAARLLPELEAERKRKNFTGRKNAAAGEMVGGVSVPYVTEARALLDEESPIIPYVDARIIETFLHVRKLAAMDDDKRDECLAKIDANEQKDDKEKKAVAVIIRDATVRDGDEWYTPPDIAAAVTWAFGGEIVCDPAHPVGGGSPVVATHTYTRDDNGLLKPWYDRTYLNPPFSKKKKWVEKAITEAALGKRIYVLIPIQPSSKYIRILMHAATEILSFTSRTAFVADEKKPEDEESDKGGAGRHSHMIVALNCSVQPLLDMGLSGDIIRFKDRRYVRASRTVRIERNGRIEENRISLEPPLPVEEPDPAEWPSLELLEAINERNRWTPEEERVHREQWNRERDEYDEWVRKGRAAVAEARSKMAEASEAARKAREAKREARKNRKAAQTAAV